MSPGVNLGKLVLRAGATSALGTIALAAVVTLSPLANYLDDPRVFELDGDAVINLGQGGDDWANSTATGSGLSKAVATSLPENPPEVVPGWPFVVADPSGYTIFTQGGSKDTNDVSQWKYTSGSVPDKDEITNAYAAAYQVTTSASGAQPHTWIYFGADRYANNGDSNIGFWFLQNGIHADNVTATSATSFTGTPCPAAATNCNPGDLHRDGDIFIVSAFTQGGAIGTIQVYHWDHNAGLVLDDNQNAAQCNPNSPGQSLVCAIINTQATKAPWPYTTKTPDPVVNGIGGANDFPHGAFFEGGFDLTGFFNLLGKPQPCFSSFLAETRSSQTTSAQLKDFVLGNFQLCSVSISKTCSISPTPPQVLTVNGVGYVRYSFTGNVINDGAGSIFNLAVSDTFPSGAINKVLNQPVTPVGGLASGGQAAYGGTFDVPTIGEVTNTASASAAAFDGGPPTVTSDHNGNPATTTAKFGGPTPQVTGCNAAPNPALSLAKSCTVGLSPTAGGVVLKLLDSITVCNTSTDATTISGITLTNNVVLNGPGSGTDSTVVSNLSLPPASAAPLNCKTYTPTYTPTTCAGGDPTLTGGRCQFADTVRIDTVASTPKDEFGNTVPVGVIPNTQGATCNVCPFGACTLQGVP